MRPPSTSPKTSGAMGKPVLRIIKPTTPKISISKRSNSLPLMTYTPTILNMAIKGMSIHFGICNIFASRRTRGRLSTINTRLPINIEAATPQNMSGLSTSMVGPGLTPSVIRAPSITAVVSLPGKPSTSSGINEPTAEELLADSGAATPRRSPLPKLPFSPAIFFSVL